MMAGLCLPRHFFLYTSVAPCPPILSCSCLRLTSSLFLASMTLGFVSFARARPRRALSVLMQFWSEACSLATSSHFMCVSFRLFPALLQGMYSVFFYLLVV